eukprot:6478793-Amphidinium_carterae.1
MCSIEVYGVEWSYGFTQTSGTGVSMCKPRAHPMHAYRQTVEMGQTRCTEEQASDIVQELLDQWDGRDYHLLKHNCLDFCNALLKKLGLGPIPAWVDRYGRAAESVGKVMYTPISAAKIAGDYGRRLAGVKRTSKDCPPADSPNFNGEDMYARYMGKPIGCLLFHHKRPDTSGLQELDMSRYHVVAKVLPSFAPGC